MKSQITKNDLKCDHTTWDYIPYIELHSHWNWFQANLPQFAYNN